MTKASTPRVVIRDASPADAAGIAGIYNHYVSNTTVTFEEEPVGAAEIESRIAETRSASLPWLVAEDAEDHRLLGYAYAGKWKGRCAYRYSVEVTVYLDAGTTGRGIGSQLYTRLFHLLKAGGMHSAIGGIALPNEASVRLHEKLGMQKVAHFKEVGFKLNQWVDVGYWQCAL